MTRQPVTARTRFEVFKRDKFTCQYCGARAPDVVLHADHVHPVAEGGTNDILNLITSCSTCNGGKGAKLLSDASAIDRQHEMLAELEERRQQLEMMLRWRDELQNLRTDTVDMIVQRIIERTGLGPNASGRADIARWLKRLETGLLLRAIDEAIDSYATFDGDSVTETGWEKFFSMVPGVANVLKQADERPYLKRLFYIQGIIRNRSKARRYDCVDYLEHLHLCGVELDDMERRAKRLTTLEDFEAPYDAWLSDIGRPF